MKKEKKLNKNKITFAIRMNATDIFRIKIFQSTFGDTSKMP